jgi:hypothetical protein
MSHLTLLLIAIAAVLLAGASTLWIHLALRRRRAKRAIRPAGPSTNTAVWPAGTTGVIRRATDEQPTERLPPTLVRRELVAPPLPPDVVQALTWPTEMRRPNERPSPLPSRRPRRELVLVPIVEEPDEAVWASTIGGEPDPLDPATDIEITEQSRADRDIGEPTAPWPVLGYDERGKDGWWE